MYTRHQPSELRLTRRLGVLVLAMLHMVGATVLPAADGRLDVEAYATPTHVESEGRDDCAPHHDHVFCQAVGSIALANPSGSAVVAMVFEQAAAPAVRDVEGHRARPDPRSGASSPRAPPSA